MNDLKKTFKASNANYTLRVVVGIGILLFAYLVWPTPWKYLERPMIIGELTLPVRQHRFFDRTEVLTPQAGWDQLNDKPAKN